MPPKKKQQEEEQEKLTRIAIVSTDKCKPKRCRSDMRATEALMVTLLIELGMVMMRRSRKRIAFVFSQHRDGQCIVIMIMIMIIDLYNIMAKLLYHVTLC